MGKEEDDADPAFGYGGLLARSRLQEQDHGGWMGTPLRALIARESAGSSPARKMLADEFAGRRRSGACKGPGTLPSSGCSSPRTRTDYASRNISAGAGAVSPKPVVEFWRPEQLGALLAQEREEPESGSSFRSPSPGNRSSRRNGHNGDRKVTKVVLPDVESSQELRYLFAKDWALQTSDEDDEFWDSGTLCGIASPSPRSSRRRTRKLSSKLRHSSSSHCTPRTQRPPLSTTPSIVAIPRRSYSCRIVADDAPCVHISKPSSLGTLLAEKEIAASSSVANPEPTWSVPAAGSRRPKIASLSDISTPVRPESQSQLDFLIGKILTLRATARCSTSQATATAESPRVLQRQECPVTLPATVTTAATNPSTPHIPSPSTPDSPSLSTHEEPFTPSTLRNDGNELAMVTVAVAGAELEAPVPERVQLGILLERTREEHAWRSRMSSPLAASSCISTDIVCLSSSPARNPELIQHEQNTATTAATAPPLGTTPELDSPSLVVEDAQTVMAEPLLVIEDAQTVMAEPLLVIEDAQALMGVVIEDAREERPSSTQRVSLLSLLNQDMEMDLEAGVQLERLLCGGCRVEEDGEEQETDEEEAGEQAETTRREELDPMCCVCMVGVKGAAFIPCGHTFCRKCCREVRRSLGSCPLCNQAIVDVLKLY